jgi:hypothetical protein
MTTSLGGDHAHDSHRFSGQSPQGLSRPPAGLAVAEAGLPGWDLLRGDLMLPMAVLKESALAAQPALDGRFLPRARVWIWRRTARPPCRPSSGADRSSPVPGPSAWPRCSRPRWRRGMACAGCSFRTRCCSGPSWTRWCSLQDEVPGWWVGFLVDSEAQVEQIEAWARDRQWPGCWPVLLEIGIAGQRTGCREATKPWPWRAASMPARVCAWWAWSVTRDHWPAATTRRTGPVSANSWTGSRCWPDRAWPRPVRGDRRRRRRADPQRRRLGHLRPGGRAPAARPGGSGARRAALRLLHHPRPQPLPALPVLCR